MIERPKLALSVWQPSAWLIVNGYKDVENRSWAIKFRGRIYVHAGLRPVTINWAELRKTIFTSGHLVPEIMVLSLGGIIGEVDVVDCLAPKAPCNSPWAELGQFHWILANAIAYEHPIRTKGKLGLFVPNVEVNP